MHISDICRRPPVTCARRTTASELARLMRDTHVGDVIVVDPHNMRSKGVRRLPVVDGHNSLIGVVTADDVTRFLAEELTEVVRIAPNQILREQAVLDPVGR